MRREKGQRAISVTSNYRMTIKIVSRRHLQHKVAKGTKKVKLSLYKNKSYRGSGVIAPFS
jgi:hypothetical protein